MAVHRDVTLDADPELVWELLTRPDDLAAWLGAEVELDAIPGGRGRVIDQDGTVRHLVVDEVAPGQRLSWRWWIDTDGEGQASRVDLTVVETAHGTQVRVVEAPLAAAPVAQASAASAWSARLGDLEILVLFAAAALLA